MEKKSRYNTIDEIRGLAIVSMILFHAAWDLVYMFGADWPWYRSAGAYIWQQSICWSFILISGFCFSLGRRQLLRGLITFGCGLAVTAVTCIFSYDERVIFGVLTLLGSCTLLMLPLSRLLRSVSPVAGICLSSALFFLTRNINDHFLGFEGLNLIRLPDSLYCSPVSTFLGFPEPDFFSTDYFSLFPWFFLFAAGYFLFRCLEKSSIMTALTPQRIRPLGFIGRHSLIIYMVHQPILYGVFLLLSGI
ncbi:MAG: DUF1624 domain-containing protein [Parasporobacterium sp.]|nr:DUF1624 domain-containing protein [Parasporobacterium sp.]